MPEDANTAKEQVRNIVVLGGSYGGVSIAHNLLKHTIPPLQKYDQYQVVLVSASAEALCRPACPRAMISDAMLDQSRLFVRVQKAFEQYPKEHFSFVHATAISLDHEARNVTVHIGGTDKHHIPFHALVIATGASTPSPLLSLAGDAKALRSVWEDFRETLKIAKSIIIAGGGPAGVETAAELGEHLNGRAGLFSSVLQSPRVKITVVTAGKQILPVLRPELAERAEKMLGKFGVTVVKDVRVEKVEPDDAGMATNLTCNTCVSLSDGTVLEADLYIPATGMKPNTSFVPSNLLTKHNGVDTNAVNLRVKNGGPRVYAIGDVSSHSRPAVHNILEAVPVLSRTMKHDLLQYAEGHEQGTTELRGKPFVADEGETQLVPIGTRGGVGAMKGWKLPSWAVWLIKGRDYWLWTTPRLWSGKQWEKEA